MGKKDGSSKGGKKVNSVFKVAGAKSLKIKNKAKPVAAKMKQIAGQRTDLQSQLDNKFSSLQDKIRRPRPYSALTYPVTEDRRREMARYIIAEDKAKEEKTRKTNDEINNLTANLQLS